MTPLEMIRPNATRPEREELARAAALIVKLAAGSEDNVPALVDAILDCAAQAGASDVHLESRADGVAVRYRIDGQLLQIARVPADRAANIFARLKMMSRVVTYRKRQPQDGRVADALGGALRTAFMPTLHGEKAVLRLPNASAPRELDDLGFQSGDLARLKRVLSLAQGTIIFTGPCSSGKSTSIYAALRHLLAESPIAPNIASLEDPIEQEIEGVNQTQIDLAGGLTFLSGLRTLLRQDPNVIVVGEVRDEETAQTIVQAGLSGHVVITTLHSGTAAQVFARLLHMKIEPFLLASAITGVVAQRLARRLCAACRKSRPITKMEIQTYFANTPPPGEVFSPTGCGHCHGTGYIGRLAIYELCVPEEPLREAVLRSEPTAALHAHAVAAGMTPLLNSAACHAALGDTSLEEIARIIG